MPDEMDFAQKRSQLYIEELKKKRETEAKTVEPQLILDGIIVCKECEEPIPLKRLELMPHCVRCVTCQQEWENK